MTEIIDREAIRRDRGLPMTRLALIANGLRQVRGAGLAKIWVSVDDAELLAHAIEERNLLLDQVEERERAIALLIKTIGESETP